MRTRAALPALLAALAVTLSPLAVQASETATDETVRLEPTAADLPVHREEWFGIYAGNDKLGYLHSSVGHRGADRGFEAENEMHLKVVTLGEKREVRSIESLLFADAPPYRLVSGLGVIVQGAYTQEVRVERRGDGYSASIQAAGTERELPVPGLDYTLADILTPEIWLRGERRRGDRLAVRSFTLADLEQGVDTYEVQSIDETVVDGVPIAYYEVDLHSSVGGALGTALFDTEGRMISGRIASKFELRRESAEQATDFDYAADVYLLGMASVDQPLGDPRTIRRLVLEVDGDDPEMIPDFYRQSVGRDAETGRWVLRLGEAYGTPPEATAEEIAEASAESVDHPIHDERIRELATRAVDEADTPMEKVVALVGFVDRFLTDSYSAEPLTVMDMLTTRRGDCTEHALLFTTLARSLGLPAREVTGLLYMGDQTQAFGGHAWNEVVVDGHWLPVDPTWGEVEINPTHIRLGPRTGHDASAEALFSDYEFKVLELERVPEAEAEAVAVSQPR